MARILAFLLEDTSVTAVLKKGMQEHQLVSADTDPSMGVGDLMFSPPVKLVAESLKISDPGAKKGLQERPESPGMASIFSLEKIDPITWSVDFDPTHFSESFQNWINAIVSQGSPDVLIFEGANNQGQFFGERYQNINMTFSRSDDQVILSVETRGDTISMPRTAPVVLDPDWRNTKATPVTALFEKVSLIIGVGNRIATSDNAAYLHRLFPASYRPVILGWSWGELFASWEGNIIPDVIIKVFDRFFEKLALAAAANGQLPALYIPWLCQNNPFELITAWGEAMASFRPKAFALFDAKLKGGADDTDLIAHSYLSVADYKSIGHIKDRYRLMRLWDSAQAVAPDGAVYQFSCSEGVGEGVVALIDGNHTPVPTRPALRTRRQQRDREVKLALDRFGDPLPITSSVGFDGVNDKQNVDLVIQQLETLGWFTPLPDFDVRRNVIHLFLFVDAIAGFQASSRGYQNAGRMPVGVDGRVDPGGATAKWLNALNAPQLELLEAEGIGFENYEIKSENGVEGHGYGTQWLQRLITSAGEHYEETYRLSRSDVARITINDASLKMIRDTRAHATHETGMCFDLRPPRQDGTAGGGMTWRTEGPRGYDRPAMRAQFESIWQAGANSILFNDPVLISSGLCEYRKNHDNHAHVEVLQDIPISRQNYLLEQFFAEGRLLVEDPADLPVLLRSDLITRAAGKLQSVLITMAGLMADEQTLTVKSIHVSEPEAKKKEDKIATGLSMAYDSVVLENVMPVFAKDADVAANNIDQIVLDATKVNQAYDKNKWNYFEGKKRNYDNLENYQNFWFISVL